MNIFGIILNTTDLWLLAATGACLAWFIPHRLAIGRENSNRHNDAAEKFHSTVITTLSGLYPIPTEWPKDESIANTTNMFKSKFPALQAAVTEFAKTLPWYKRFFFMRAWRTYRLGKDGQDGQGQDYWQYIPHHNNGVENGKYYEYDNHLTYQSDFKLNIDRLLTYAK